MTTATAPIPPRPQARVLVGALLAMGLLAWWIEAAASARQALLFATGIGVGAVLYQSSFGFTSAYRALMVDRESAGLRAQMVMLGAACLLFFPVLAAGSLWGTEVSGFVAPAGTSVAVGAFVFGIGMQLGGGCASGTLFALGGGSTRMLVTLFFFVLGSVLGVTQRAWWDAQPEFDSISLITELGWPLALALHLAVFAAIYGFVAALERARHGRVAPIASAPSGRSGLLALRTGWPMLAGALGLAGLNFATLWLAGQPLGITAAYGLWGGKALLALGVPVTTWSGYSSAGMQAALQDSVLADVTSVMDFGIILGALAAAGAAGRFKPQWQISTRHFAACMLGGLLMGWGARLAYGCNIGAFFSGIASGSLHGWLWIVCALVGTWLGVFLRPWFDLSGPRPQSAC